MNDNNTSAGVHEPKNALEQAKDLALVFARSNTKCNFVAVNSHYGNLIIPVVPCFEQEASSSTILPRDPRLATALKSNPLK